MFELKDTQDRVSCGRQCCRFFVSELHYSKLCLCYKDRKAFAYTPWLPYSTKWQWIYVVYRWVIMLYFLSWLIVLTVKASQEPAVQNKFFIYLTDWGFLVLNAYFFVSAVSVLLSNVCNRHLPLRPLLPTGLTDKLEDLKLSCTDPALAFVNGLHWILAIVGLEYAVGITILFWTFFNNPAIFSYSLSADSIHVHMLNGIVACIDMLITGLPFRILHVVYVIVFGSAYVIFSGIYYAANGTDILGNRFIYPILDYDSNPGLAAGVGISCAVFLSSVLHSGFILLFMCRHWISHRLQTRVYHAI